MKKVYTAILLVVVFVSSVFSQTWTIQNSNTTQNLWSVWFLSNNIGIACGTGGVILKTTNGGTNWISKTSGTTNDLMNLQFLNSNTGMCFGFRGPVLKTTNAGETWGVMAFGSIPATNILGGGWFLDANNAVIGYAKSSYNQSRILKTTNGGTSWDTVFTPSPSVQGWISYMHFSDSQNGYATVAYDTVYKTTNGGLNWSVINLGGTANLWTSGVWFFNSQTGFIGGGVYPSNSGELFKTTNGGANWQLLTNLYAIAKIQFIDNTYGYSLASNNSVGNGRLINTTNGGNNWIVVNNASDSLNGMHFLSTSLGYAVGVRGRILRYGFPIGISTISTVIPEKYSLSQNYPNPFNPTTKIKFSIVSSPRGLGGDLVQLKIYDVTGREVQTLVNESLKPGTYEATFDARRGGSASLNSGVYFYKLMTDGFAETKKLILLK